MKSTIAVLLLLLAVCCPPACAGPVLYELAAPLLSGSPGDVLTFQGTLSNTLGYEVYLNSWTLNLIGFGEDDIDSTPFLLGPYPLGIDETTAAFDWFTVTIPVGTAPAVYDGTFTVLGGATTDDLTVLDSLDFQVQVAEATSAVPEPGTWVLMVAGLGLVTIGSWHRKLGRNLLLGTLLLAGLASVPAPAWAVVAAPAPGTPMPGYQWHTFYAPGEPNSDNQPVGRGVAVDSQGYAYVVGVTKTPESFAPGVPLHSVEANPYPYAGFIMKLSPAGDLIWHTFYHIGPSAVAIGPDGNLVLTGRGSFCGDGLTQQPIYGKVCPFQGFAMKMDTNGMLLWYTVYPVYGEGIAVDWNTGNVYVGGDGNYITGPFPQPPLQHPAPREAPLVIALDPNGYYLWHTFLESGFGRSIAVDGLGNIIVGGHTNGSVSVTKLHGPGAYFGDVAWLRAWGGNRWALGVAADAAGNVYATGQAWGNAPLMTPLHAVGHPDPESFVAKFDADGNPVWYTMYGADRGHGRSIVLDPRGYVLVHGLNADHDFTGDGGAASLHDNTQSPGNKGGHYLLALNTDGAYQWHTIYGSTHYDRPKGIAQDANYNVYLTGSSGSNWTGDNGAQPLNPRGGPDAVFIQKLSLKAAPTVTWTNPAAIPFGSALGPAQLNASANVAGSFTYTPPAGTVLAAGNGQTLSVLFTPTDTAGYSSVTKTVTINVLPPTPTPARIVSSSVLSRTASEIRVAVTIANSGGTAAANVNLTTVRINSAAGATLPVNIGTVAAGGSSTAVVTFPLSLGASGAAATLTVAGSYTGGIFNSTSRIRLP